MPLRIHLWENLSPFTFSGPSRRHKGLGSAINRYRNAYIVHSNRYVQMPIEILVLSVAVVWLVGILTAVLKGITETGY